MANRITRDYCLLFEETVRRRADGDRFWNDLNEDFRKRTVRPGDFSVRQLFENFVRDSHGDPCGREILESWMPDGGYSVSLLSEAGMGAVTTSAFTKIIGQIVYNEILDAWNNPAFVADQLAKTVPTKFLDGEKIAGISAVADEAEAIGETQAYPLTGLTGSYVETPVPTKRGHILPLTKEVLIADRTGVLLERAQTITQTMRINKEKRVVDAALGVSNTWKRNGSAATDTYGDSAAAPHNFDNLAGSNGLTDYTDIENALKLLNAMTDPDTGEPIIITATQLIVDTNKLYTARNIVNATQIRTSSSNLETLSPNPINAPSMGGVQVQDLQILSSPFITARYTAGSVTNTTWFIGDFRKAFRYMEVWPLSTVEMPQNSDWEFRNDIVRAWKVSEFGVVAVVEPRYVVKCTA
jgi:hypothetical protein